MILFTFLLVGFLVLQEITADFASIKPKNSTTNFNYVGVTWLSNSVALAIGQSSLGGVVVRSTNLGMSWIQVGSNMGFSGLYGIATRQISTTWYTIVVDDGGVVYRSIDRGLTWSSLDTYLPAALLGCSIGSNGYAFLAGTNYVGYHTNVATASNTWTQSSSLTSLYYYDIRLVYFLNFFFIVNS
jgi:hypothetical protein